MLIPDKRELDNLHDNKGGLTIIVIIDYHYTKFISVTDEAGQIHSLNHGVKFTEYRANYFVVVLGNQIECSTGRSANYNVT